MDDVEEKLVPLDPKEDTEPVLPFSEQKAKEKESSFNPIAIIRGFTEIEHIYEVAMDTNSFICGGYPRYMCSPHEDPVLAGDVDLFPQTKESFEQNKSMFEGMDFSIKHENEVSITLDNPSEGRFHYTPTVQIIKPVSEGRILTMGSLEDILSNFDFTVVRIGILDHETCLADDRFLEDELSKKLFIRNIHCPISTLQRTAKYTKKGYWLSPRESLKLFVEWNERGTEYQDKLIDLFAKTEGKISQEEIDNLEALLRID